MSGWPSLRVMYASVLPSGLHARSASRSGASETRCAFPPAPVVTKTSPCATNATWSPSSDGLASDAPPVMLRTSSGFVRESTGAVRVCIRGAAPGFPRSRTAIWSPTSKATREPPDATFGKRTPSPLKDVSCFALPPRVTGIRQRL